MTFTFADLRNIIVLISAVAGVIGTGYHLYVSSVKSKLDTEDERLDANIKKLWEKKDQLDRDNDELERGMLDRFHRLQLDATNNFATKSELSEAIVKIEHHLDRLQDDMNEKHKEVLKQLESFRA